MRVAKYGYILIFVVLCIAGIAIAVLPDLSTSVIGTFFGITMLVFGIIKLIGYFSKDMFRLAFQFDLQFGILLCILGAIILIKQKTAREFVCIAYVISMIADCLFKAKTAFDAKRFGIKKWWLTLVLTIAAGIAGVIVVIVPVVNIQSVNTLFGIPLLCEGALSLSVAVSMVKIIEHQQPDVIDAEFCEVWEEK